MTKKDLLKQLNKIPNPNEEERTLIERIKTSLLFFDDKKFNFKRLSSVESLKNYIYCGPTLLNDSDPKRKKDLEALVVEIETIAKNMSDKNEKTKISLKIFSTVAVVSILVALVLTILDATDVKEIGKLSIIFDGLGLCTGIAFFLYERIDDAKRSKNLAKEIAVELEKISYPSGNYEDQKSFKVNSKKTIALIALFIIAIIAIMSVTIIFSVKAHSNQHGTNVTITQEGTDNTQTNIIYN